MAKIPRKDEKIVGGVEKNITELEKNKAGSVGEMRAYIETFNNLNTNIVPRFTAIKHDFELELSVLFHFMLNIKRGKFTALKNLREQAKKAEERIESLIKSAKAIQDESKLEKWTPARIRKLEDAVGKQAILARMVEGKYHSFTKLKMVKDYPRENLTHANLLISELQTRIKQALGYIELFERAGNLAEFAREIERLHREEKVKGGMFADWMNKVA